MKVRFPFQPIVGRRPTFGEVDFGDFCRIRGRPVAPNILPAVRRIGRDWQQ